MDFTNTSSENLYSMDAIVAKMRDYAKVIDAGSASFDSSDIKKIAEAFNIFADSVKIANEIAVAQAVENAIDYLVAKLKDKFGGEK